MLDVPDVMLIETESFTKRVRQHSEVSSADRYREFICENIVGVIENTFPLFSETQNDNYLNQLAQEFVSSYHAMEPEFHQIATEFLRFAQKRTDLTAEIITLIEYEWIAFSLEIDLAINKSIPPLWESINAQPNAFIVRCNPLMQLIEVRFKIEGKEVNFLSVKEPSIVYCMYRTKEHTVVSQQLRKIDIAIIQLISQEPNLTLVQVERKIHAHLIKFNFMDWVKYFNENQLINIQFLGERND